MTTYYKQGSVFFVKTGEYRKPMHEYYLDNEGRVVFKTGDLYEGPMNSWEKNRRAYVFNNTHHTILKMWEPDPLC